MVEYKALGSIPGTRKGKEGVEKREGRREGGKEREKLKLASVLPGKQECSVEQGLSLCSLGQDTSKGTCSYDS